MTDLLLRIWTTEYHLERLDELVTFADEVSAPMFRSFDGCLGLIYAHDDSTWITYTLWESREAIAAAERTARYKSTVSEILSRGFLKGQQTTTVLNVTRLEVGQD